MLAEENRRAKLHEAVERFLGAMMPGPAFVEIENAHHMDEASADLLKFLVGTLPTHRWLFGVARRPGPAGFVAPESASVTRIELKPIAHPGCAAHGGAGDEGEPAAGARARGGRAALRRQPAVPARPVAVRDPVGRHRGAARFGRGRGARAHRRAVARGPRRGSTRRGLRPLLPPPDARVVRPRGRSAAARRRHVGAAGRPLRRGRRRLPALPPVAAARHGLRGPAVQGAATPAHGGRRARRGGGRPSGRGRRHPVAALRCRGRARAGVALRHACREGRRAGLRVRRSREPLCARDRGGQQAPRPCEGRARARAGVARRRLVPGRGVPQGPRRVHDRAGAGHRREADRGGPAAQAVARRGEARPVSRGAALGRARARGARGCAGHRGRAPEREGQRVVRDGAAGAGQFGTRHASGPSAQRARARRSTIPR